MLGRGLVWATDRSARRLQTLRKRAARTGAFNYRAQKWEGTTQIPARGACHGVLLDAPCSGVGTWQRNPDARWNTTAADVQELSVIQSSLLKNAAQAVRPGGKLIYSVCTLTRKETTGVAENFTLSQPGFERLKLRHPLDSAEQPRADLVISNEDFGSNGMYIAAWRREGGPGSAS